MDDYYFSYSESCLFCIISNIDSIVVSICCIIMNINIQKLWIHVVQLECTPLIIDYRDLYIVFLENLGWNGHIYFNNSVKYDKLLCFEEPYVHMKNTLNCLRQSPLTSFRLTRIIPLVHFPHLSIFSISGMSFDLKEFFLKDWSETNKEGIKHVLIEGNEKYV